MGQCYMRNRGANKPLNIEYGTRYTSVSTSTNPITGTVTRQEKAWVKLDITPTILLIAPTTNSSYESTSYIPRGTLKNATFVDGGYSFAGTAVSGVLLESHLYYYVGLTIPNLTPNSNGWVDGVAVYGNVCVGTLGYYGKGETWTSPDLPFHPRYVLLDGYTTQKYHATLSYWNGKQVYNGTLARLTVNENSFTLTGDDINGHFIAWD